MILTLNRGFAALAAASLLVASASAASAQTAPAQATPAPAAQAGCSDDQRHNATREQAEFTSGGRTIRGLIYKPRTSNGAGVVLLHGFRGLDDDAHAFDPHAIQLATRGYTVLVPNIFDARPYRARRNGLDMNTWAAMGADAVRHVGTIAGVDPQKVGLWGYSLGGFLATDGSVSPDAPAAVAVGVSAGTDIWSEPTRGHRAMPILLIHGRADPSVTPSSMRSLATNLRLRGATVEVQMIESSQHVLEGPIWCEVFQHTRRFLDANLLPASAATSPAE